MESNTFEDNFGGREVSGGGRKIGLELVAEGGLHPSNHYCFLKGSVGQESLVVYNQCVALGMAQ